MAISKSLLARCQSTCELCTNPSEHLDAYLVPMRTEQADENSVALCQACQERIQKQAFEDADYFRFLTGSIWSEVPAVKVLAYKTLQKLHTHAWAQDALDGAYLSEEEQQWADEENEAIANQVIHKDAYGVVLQQGDTVFLTENLNVKGANFIAPKGTKVPKIKLVPDNSEQIEGKIEGSTIVLLTKYVRKSS